MIRRSDSKKIPSAVNAAENEVLAVAKGISENSGPNELAAVVSSCNFRLRDDGSYALRKPDVCIQKGADGDVFIPLRDGEHFLRLKASDGGLYVCSDLDAVSDSEYVEVKYMKLDNSGYAYKRTGSSIVCEYGAYSVSSQSHLFVLPPGKATRLTDTSLIACELRVSEFSGNDPMLDSALYGGVPSVRRYLNVYFDDARNHWVAEIVVPEPNTIPTSESSESFKPNLLLDNPYSLKDLYGYGSVGVKGIVAYQDPESSVPDDPHNQVSYEAFTVDFLDAIFKVECKEGIVHVYANAHLSLVDIAKSMDVEREYTEDEFNEMNSDMVCGVGSAVATYYSQGSSDEVITEVADAEKVCSPFMPAYTNIATFKLSRTARGICTIRINLHADGMDSESGSRTLYVYPKSKSIQELAEHSPYTYQLAYDTHIDIVFTMDSEGNMVSCHNGFDIELDNYGVYMKANPSLATATRYFLSKVPIDDSDAAYNSSALYEEARILRLQSPNTRWTLYNMLWQTQEIPAAYQLFTGVKVKDLMEKAKPNRFYMLSEINAANDKPLILKAVMSFSNTVLGYYGIWETSGDNGITWEPCKEFLERYGHICAPIPVVDATRSNESLESSDDYVKTLRCMQLLADNNEDLIIDRPDVLVVTETPKTNLFRFSVYYYKSGDSDSAKTPVCLAMKPAVTMQHSTSRELLGMLKSPERDRVFLSGTPLYSQQTSNGIAIVFPKGDADGSLSFSYAVSRENVDAPISDSDCTNPVSPIEESADGYLIFLDEATLVSTCQSITHTIRVKLVAVKQDAVQPSMSIEVLYDYISRGVIAKRDAYATTVDDGRLKFNTHTEPIVSISYESGSLVAGNDLVNDDLSVIGTDSFFPTNVTSPNVYNKLTFTYEVRFQIHNPSDVKMVIMLGSSELNRRTRLVSFSDSALDSSFANMTVKGVKRTESFLKIDSSNDWIEAAFPLDKRASRVVLDAHATIDVTYEYVLKNVLENNQQTPNIQGMSKYYVARDMSYPLQILALHGSTTVSAYPGGAVCFAYYPEYDYGPFASYEPLSKCTYAYYDGSQKPWPVYASNDYAYAYPNLSAYGSLPTPKDVIKKAIQISFLQYQANLVQTETVLLMNHAQGTDAFPNLMGGKRIYHEHRLITYGCGKPFDNSIYVSDPDSFITPLQNELTFSYGSAVTAVVPWRDYVLVFTENATYMLLKDVTSPSGYNIRIVNSQVGVPKSDGDSVQAILNGILFKSGNRAYVYMPGRYSTVDTMLNIRRISDPVASLLLEGVPVYSYVEDDEWHLYQYVGKSDCESMELVYNYAKGLWTMNVHSIFPTDAFLHGSSWRMIRDGVGALFSVGRDWDEFDPNAFTNADLSLFMRLPYGDYDKQALVNRLATVSVDDPDDLEAHDDECITPIGFSLDTGNKSSRFTVDKQFLEAKFNFMSLDDKDAFPLTLSVMADNMPHPSVVDANTDSPLWKKSKTSDFGAVATRFGDDSTNNAGVMRQMFVKYSGRGKTVRITISGRSQSRFAIYTMESRYRVLPTKQ